MPVAAAAGDPEAAPRRGTALFVYVVVHLVNHALGLISLEAMQVGPSGSSSSGVACPEPSRSTARSVHIPLGLWALYRRRTLRMPAWEATQLVFGLAIPPPALCTWRGRASPTSSSAPRHRTRAPSSSFWAVDPWAGARQAVLLLIAWIHGCMGVHYWLRFRPWYGRVARAALRPRPARARARAARLRRGAREATAIARATRTSRRELMRRSAADSRSARRAVARLLLVVRVVRRGSGGRDGGPGARAPCAGAAPRTDQLSGRA